MTIFKTFWQVVNRYKGTIILYTVMLIAFGGINFQANKETLEFTDTKPDILIVNHDKNSELTNNLITYLENNCHIVSVKDTEEARDDALFYRDVSYIIYIPKNYQENVLNGINQELQIKSTGTYQASLTEMMLKRYLKLQNIYTKVYNDPNKIIKAINNNLEEKTTIQIKNKVDTNKTSKLTSYFNFASYSIMAVTIFIICLVLTSFKKQNVKKRIIVSSTSYKEHNKLILLASFVYAIIVFLLYTLLALILLGNSLISIRGLFYLLNTFIFTICCLTLALLISNIINSKNAISGIVNVVALGSAFLCGAFIPVRWLPESVLQVAHILPAYWYINTNELLTSLEVFNLETLKPILVNYIILLLFILIFIIINNLVSHKKLKIN